MATAAVALRSAFGQCCMRGSCSDVIAHPRTRRSCALPRPTPAAWMPFRRCCPVGKGNLIFNLQGKNAFSFYRRPDGKSFRLVLRPTPEKTKDERLAWLMDGDFHEMFDVKEAPEPVPEEARIFKTVTCSVCGERFAESFAHLQNGEIVCSACYRPYTRGL